MTLCRVRKGAHLLRSQGTRQGRVLLVKVVAPHVGESDEEQAYRTQVRPTLATSSVSVLHDTDCPRRLPGATSAETSPWRSNTIRCRWMLVGWTPIRSASSSAVRPRSEARRRISVRTLLPMVSIATSTSVGMSPGTDRRGIGVILPDEQLVALSETQCQYQPLKDASRTDQGRHPMGARAPHPRSGVTAACPPLTSQPFSMSSPNPPAAGSADDSTAAKSTWGSPAGSTQPELMPRPQDSWRPTR